MRGKITLYSSVLFSQAKLHFFALKSEKQIHNSAGGKRNEVQLMQLKKETGLTSTVRPYLILQSFALPLHLALLRFDEGVLFLEHVFLVARGRGNSGLQLRPAFLDLADDLRELRVHRVQTSLRRGLQTLQLCAHGILCLC